MKSNVKHEKQKKEKVSIRDRISHVLFCEIIDALLKGYEKSENKDTMSFKAYCIGLRDLSNKAVGNDTSTELVEADEYYQKILEEGENINGRGSS